MNDTLDLYYVGEYKEVVVMAKGFTTGENFPLPLNRNEGRWLWVKGRGASQEFIKELSSNKGESMRYYERLETKSKDFQM